MIESLDVFLSHAHAHADAEWVKVLAENLVRLGGWGRPASPWPCFC